MMRKMLPGMVLLLMTGLLIPVFPVAADSLWSDQSSSLYSVKPKNFEVGDLITILIIEQATASQQAETKTGEKGSITGGAGTGFLQQYLPGFGTNWNSDTKGTGSTTRGGSLKATLSVQVKEVNPGGILTIEGRQVIKVNKAEQMIIISGNIRADDISRDNTIPSTKIANAVIEFQGKGTVNETDEPGLLVKLFNWLF